MNADRVVTAAAERAINGEEGNFGSAIISVQKTVCDHLASLRFFCTIDEAMTLLANHLQMPIPEIPTKFPLEIDPKYIFEEDVFIIHHYGIDGKRKEKEDDKVMLLDLREDAEVVITIGTFDGNKGEVTGKNKEGHYRLRILHPLKNNFMAPKVHTLGLWWVYAAINGTVPYIPIVNCNSSLKFL